MFFRVVISNTMIEMFEKFGSIFEIESEKKRDETRKQVIQIRNKFLWPRLVFLKLILFCSYKLNSKIGRSNKTEKSRCSCLINSQFNQFQESLIFGLFQNNCSFEVLNLFFTKLAHVKILSCHVFRIAQMKTEINKWLCTLETRP